MAEELRSIDVKRYRPISCVSPRRSAETGVGRVLRTADRRAGRAEPVPKPSVADAVAARTGLLTRDDPLFKLIGIGASGIDKRNL